MAVYYVPPAYNATTSTITVAATAAACTCDAPSAGFACVADPHATPGDRETWQALKALERRAEFRFFVGHPPAPRAASPRRRRNSKAHRRHLDRWRTRALGKRPSRIASG